MVSTIEAAGSHLLVYQDPHELKKRRNRLAQRKHRQHISQGASEKSRRQTIPERTSAEYSSCHSGLTSTREFWDAEPGHDALLAFEAGGDVVSAMDFPLPGSTESIKELYRASPDLEQYVTRMWQPSFPVFGSGYLSELGLESRGEFLPQNGTASAYDAPEQQSTRLHLSTAQTSFELLPSTSNMNHSSQSQPSTAAANDISTDYIVPHSSTPHAADDGSKNPQSTNADGIFDTEKSTALSAPPGTHSPKLQGENLETRFESVIRAVEKAGFESIDDMSTQYYTAIFKEDSVPYWAQARSRSRSLPTFLASLHESTKDWTDRDAQGYQQQIMHSAESVHLNELSSATKKVVQGEERRKSTEEEASASFEILWKAITELDKFPDINTEEDDDTRKYARDMVASG